MKRGRKSALEGEVVRLKTILMELGDPTTWDCDRTLLLKKFRAKPADDNTGATLAIAKVDRQRKQLEVARSSAILSDLEIKLAAGRAVRSQKRRSRKA